MQFRLTVLLSVIVLTGCAAAEEPRVSDAAEPTAEAEQTARPDANATAPFEGTWRWEGSGHKIGDIDLGEEQFVFRKDGTYTVVSKAGDGSSECYEGTFRVPAAIESGHGTIVFKGAHVPDAAEGFEREVYLDADKLEFGGAGTYRRTGPALGIRCP